MKDILNIIKSQGKPMSIDELCTASGLTANELMPKINEATDALELIVHKDKYAMPKQVGLCVGRLSCHIKGFGFLLQEEDDIFIPAKDTGSAMNGDIVAARLSSSSHKGDKREGYVVDIIKRNTEKIIGTVQKLEKKWVLVPQDKKIQFHVDIDNLGDASVDDIAQCQITKYPGKKPVMEVNVIKVLGQAGESKIDIACAIARYNIPEEFKKATIKEAKEIPQKVTEIGDRLDLRGELTITIDGDDSKDFDDAVSLDFKDDYYILKVHIADVSHYVKSTSSLDKDAYTRGNSVYFPGSVIPMLPKELSNGICSLNEGVDRYALSCFMRVDTNGKVFEEKIMKTVINSNHRMTYNNVNRILAGDLDVKNQYSDIVDMAEHMDNLRQILLNRRVKEGSLEFDIPEANFILDDTGRVKDVVLHHRGKSEHMIEEFMLLANKTVCRWMINANLPCAYRVHETPTPEKLEILSAFLGSFGYKLDKENVSSKNFQGILNRVKGEAIEPAVNMVTLRTLQKARYAAVNFHHFGLAFEDYCHFTSPIRRYADLIVHRILSDYLDGKPVQIDNMDVICNHVSETEKNAMDAEMHINDLYRCHYLKDYVGQEFEGVISGMNNSGFYVMLPNTCEGMVRLADIKGDYFVFNDKLFHIIGERTRKIFRLGDRAKVLISKVNEELGQVDMQLISE